MIKLTSPLYGVVYVAAQHIVSVRDLGQGSEVGSKVTTVNEIFEVTENAHRIVGEIESETRFGVALRSRFS